MYVPKGSIDNYKSIRPWKQFKNIIEEDIDDEYGNNNGDKPFYTLTATLTDKGNLPEESVAIIDLQLKQIVQTFTTPLAEAKSALDRYIQESKNSFAVEEGYHYTITYYLKDSAGNVQYSKKIIVNGSQVTVQ